MASDTRIPKTEISGIYGALIKRFSQKLLGQVPDGSGVMWPDKPALETFMGLGQKATRWKACDASLKAHAHMVVASLLGCTSCLDFGYLRAHNDASLA